MLRSRSSLMSLSLPDASRCKRVAAIRWLAVFKRTTLGADGPGGHRAPARLSLEPEALVINLREDR